MGARGTINYAAAFAAAASQISRSEKRVQKRLTERITNLFEYTSNLIRGPRPPGQPPRQSLSTWPWGIESGVGARSGEGVCVYVCVCVPRAHPQPSVFLSPLYKPPRSHREKRNLSHRVRSYKGRSWCRWVLSPQKSGPLRISEQGLIWRCSHCGCNWGSY